MEDCYFDVNATARILPEVIAYITQQMGEKKKNVGNASSPHRQGRFARAIIEQARMHINSYFGAHYEVIFTSGATEANNLFAHQISKDDLWLVGATEHPSILEPAYAHGKIGGKIVILPVDQQGLLSLDYLEQTLRSYREQTGKSRIWLSVQGANSESGVVQDFTAISKIAWDYDAFYHCDAVQLLGKVALDFTQIPADFVTISAHKIGGILGAGALLSPKNFPIKAQILGGTQENRQRAGSENSMAIGAFAVAMAQLDRIDHGKMLILRQYLETGLQKKGRAESTQIIAQEQIRLSNTVFALHPHLQAQQILMQLDLANIAAASGSACSSGKISASYVLQAMGINSEVAKRAVRFSFDATIDKVAMDYVIAQWQKL